MGKNIIPSRKGLNHQVRIIFFGLIGSFRIWLYRLIETYRGVEYFIESHGKVKVSEPEL